MTGATRTVRGQVRPARTGGHPYHQGSDERRSQLESITVSDPVHPEDSSGAEKEIYYPLTKSQRDSYRTSSGKTLTLHQWKVYDAVKSVPYGKVASYDVIAKMLGSSPRAVGNALRRNPFAPYIPCHRVITSRGYIGGFFGEWGLPGNAEGKREKAGMVVKGDGTVVRKKLEVLANEGVDFDGKGFVINPSERMWAGTRVDG